MKLKHTPAPWKAVFNGNYWDIKCQCDSDDDIGKYSPNIAYCINNEYYEHTKEHSETNARLIAAAPEMIEILIKTVKYYPEFKLSFKKIIEKVTGLKIEEELK